MIIHVVKNGDSIYNIAQRYGVDPNMLILQNGIGDPDRLVVGQALIVPGETENFTIRRGDNLYSISKNLGISQNELKRLNPDIRNFYGLQIGQQIVAPSGGTQREEIIVNGFVFPYTKETVLQQVLPQITFVSLFSYEANPNGTLNDIESATVLAAAAENRATPAMTVSNIRGAEGFSSDLASVILNDEGTQTALVNNIVQTMRKKGYKMLVLDFEYIYPEDKDKYTAFVEKCSTEMRDNGYLTAVAVAPKLRENQTGLLYEAHDYKALGAAADYLILMTYEWGYMYGPAMAVAPVPEVRAVVEYALSVVQSNKILLGMPNYGYDWTLPFMRGSAARVVSNTGAINLALEYRAAIEYDETAQAPYFNYYDNNGNYHEVWFDDPRSVAARLQLVDDYGLAGVSYWTVSNYSAMNFAVLNSMFTVKKF